MGERIANILACVLVAWGYVINSSKCWAVAGSYRALSIMASRLSYAFCINSAAEGSCFTGGYLCQRLLTLTVI